MMQRLPPSARGSRKRKRRRKRRGKGGRGEKVSTMFERSA